MILLNWRGWLDLTTELSEWWEKEKKIILNLFAGPREEKAALISIDWAIRFGSDFAHLPHREQHCRKFVPLDPPLSPPWRRKRKRRRRKKNNGFKWIDIWTYGFPIRNNISRAHCVTVGLNKGTCADRWAAPNRTFSLKRLFVLRAVCILGRQFY